MIEGLDQKVEKFLDRWTQIHDVEILKTAAGRKYDPDLDNLEQVPSGKIERVGTCLVYPNPNFPGWYSVKTPDGIIIDFAGYTARKSAVDWAKKWCKA